MSIQWSHTNLAEFSTNQVSDILNLSFEDYMVPLKFTPELVASMMRTQGVDLLESRLLLADGEVAGAAMIARRGTISRVASLGVYKPYRQRGGARYLMNTVIDEAKARKDTIYELEAVEGNDKAIALYADLGFKRIRLLVGYLGEGLEGEDVLIEEITIPEAARSIGSASVWDAPWMLTGESLAYCRRPCEAYRFQSAAAIVIPQGEDSIELKAISMTADPSVQIDTCQLLLGLQKKFCGHKWHAGPFHPDELTTPIIVKAGFCLMDLKQGQWRLDLA